MTNLVKNHVTNQLNLKHTVNLAANLAINHVAIINPALDVKNLVISPAISLVENQSQNKLNHVINHVINHAINHAIDVVKLFAINSIYILLRMHAKRRLSLTTSKLHWENAKSDVMLRLPIA